MNKFKPQMQQLEGREVPATLSLTGGTLNIAAAAGGSYVEVDPTGVAGQVSVLWQDMSGSHYGSQTFTGVTKVNFTGAATGFDEYYNNTAIAETVVGEGATEYIYSGYGSSNITAGSGETLVVSRAQTSTVTCGTGYDMVLNYGGHMTVNADPPGDYIYNP